MAKAKTTRKAVQNTTDTAETKRTTAAKSAAAEKQFKDADMASILGLPEDMTKEQHENRARLGALGY
jgi:hypothetical protein